jgi:hypothetical protein
MARISLAPMMVFSNDATTHTIFPATPWYPASEWELIRDGVETYNMPAATALEVSIGIEVCDVVSAPTSPPTALATMRNIDGLTFPVAFVDMTATTGPKQLVRGVYLVKNKVGGGTTKNFCWASGVIETQKK